MPKSLDEISKDATELPQVEQLKLARILLDLADSSADSSEEVQAAWDEEIARRLEELRSGATTAIPLEEVKAKIERRFRS